MKKILLFTSLLIFGIGVAMAQGKPKKHHSHHKIHHHHHVRHHHK